MLEHKAADISNGWWSGMYIPKDVDGKSWKGYGPCVAIPSFEKSILEWIGILVPVFVAILHISLYPIEM